MRIACLETSSGISGDMMLGACLDAGVPAELLRDALQQLGLGATLDIQTVSRGGIRALKATIVVHPPESPASLRPARLGIPEPGHSGGHLHHHAHRPLSEIRQIIARSPLTETVKQGAMRTFELLASAEAQIHAIPLESVHFHEVGAVDAIADIVLTWVAVESMQVDAWHCSPLNTGEGQITCQHGTLPVPAPATAELLRGCPTYSSGHQAELVTPTGAALVRSLDCSFAARPILRIGRIGYGAGQRNPESYANVLRLSLGETSDGPHAPTERIAVLETAVDDISPQILGHLMDRVLALGALDIMYTPVFMKKNRPGTLITVLSPLSLVPSLQDTLFRETGTLGIRVREETRSVLKRTFVTVSSPWGPVRVKIGWFDGAHSHANPEFSDCRDIAIREGLPVTTVVEAVRQQYHANHGR